MEYRSRTTLLGLPLIHVAIGVWGVAGGGRKVAVGWIAVGDVAVGVLLACGGVAAGGIAVGGASLGALALGGVALGLVAIGGLAVGLLAIGGAAVAWYMAVGGLAVAHDLAVGGAAFAQHAVGSPSSGLETGRPHPHAPFRIVDALAVALVVGAVTALLVHLRRERASQG